MDFGFPGTGSQTILSMYRGIFVLSGFPVSSDIFNDKFPVFLESTRNFSSFFSKFTKVFVSILEGRYRPKTEVLEQEEQTETITQRFY